MSSDAAWDWFDGFGLARFACLFILFENEFKTMKLLMIYYLPALMCFLFNFMNICIFLTQLSYNSLKSSQFGFIFSQLLYSLGRVMDKLIKLFLQFKDWPNDLNMA